MNIGVASALLFSLLDANCEMARRGIRGLNGGGAC